MSRREAFNSMRDAVCIMVHPALARSRRRAAVTLLITVSAACIGMPTVATALELVSINVSSRTGDAASSGVSVNADGSFVAFYSNATDLVLGDTNQARDVFLRDRIHQRTELISVSDTGAQGNLSSQAAGDAPSVDGDGQIVAFDSDATNLVPNDTNGHSDVFVRLRATGSTDRVSLSSNGTQGNGASLWPSINSDGRLVAFQSLATNLVLNDTNNQADIFVRDRINDTTERVCDTVQPNNFSFGPAISADGNVVAFTSAATNLGPADHNGHLDIYTCNRTTGEIDLVSVSTGDVQGDADSILPAISEDGRFVAFKSLADNLVPNDRNGLVDVFVRDRLNRTTERISVNFLGGDANDISYPPSISYDGRFVAFGSAANNIVRADVNLLPSVFVRDRKIGLTLLVDVNDKGEQANGATPDVPPSVSGDGKMIGFVSLATNLTNNQDLNGTSDVFIQGNPVCQLLPGECGEVITPTRSATATATFTPGTPMPTVTGATPTATRTRTPTPTLTFTPGPCLPGTPDGTACDDGNMCTHDDVCHGGVCTGTAIDCSVADACHDAGTCNPATGLCPNPKPNDTPCDDGNLCTSGDKCEMSLCTGTAIDCSVADACHDAGACNPTTGLCPNPKPNDTPCNDGNLCTSGDKCEMSLCTGTAIDCSVADACHDAGACNPTTGLCPNPKPNDMPCNDGNLCTSGDKCEMSLCTGTAINCSMADGCHDAGICNPTTGLCPNPKPNDTPCDDGNLCTSGDKCEMSLCTGTAIDCSVADACHDAGACNPTTGLCPNPKPNDTPCNDGNLCTSGDKCEMSLCTGTAINCSMADGCHDAGTCNPTTGLCPNPKPNDTPCNDGNLCTSGDKCEMSLCTGTALDCSGTDACHDAGACNPATGLCPNPKPNGTPCNDGNLCTSGDKCEMSLCTGTALDCSGTDACHDAGACNPATGLCPNPKPNGTPCNDGNLCTSGDKCEMSLCTGTAINCSMADGCHDAGTCNPTTGLCPNPKPNDTPCNDGNLCTSGDKCEMSLCTGTALDCSGTDACHDAGACNPATGLCPNPKPNGTPCNDGNLCTSGDKCEMSLCTGTALDCSGTDACHDAGACNPATGLCPNPKPNGTPCDDGNLCTSGDKCEMSLCTGTALDCSAADACHDAGACNPTTGLCSNPKPNGTTCNDGNLCTRTDTCQDGSCTGANPVTCSPIDQCHDAGACDPTTGQCSTPTKADGTTCNDDLFCTTPDACRSGVCTGPARNCDDGIFCNGTETCDETTKMCKSSGSPCASGAVCDNTHRSCGPTPTPVPGLDRDGCQCTVTPGGPHSPRGALVWFSGVLALWLRRRRVTARKRGAHEPRWVLGFAFFLTALLAARSARADGPFVGADIGVSEPTNGNYRGSVHTGAALNPYLGYMFTDYLGVQGQVHLSYQPPDYHRRGFNNEGEDSTLLGGTIGPRLSYTLIDLFEFYATVQGGVFTGLSGRLTHTAPGFSVGPGINYMVTPDLGVGLFGRWNRAYMAPRPSDIGPEQVPSERFAEDIQWMTAGIGLLYSFPHAEAPPPPPTAPPPLPPPPPAPVKQRIVLRAVYFDFDKSDIRPDGAPVLDEAVEILKQEGSVKVVAEGHTDGIGSAKYNIGLSKRRATSVRKYMADHGLDADRIRTEGFGKSRPVASNETEDGRAQNRRVELRVE